jgi:predicted metallopeptidase
MVTFCKTLSLNDKVKIRFHELLDDWQTVSKSIARGECPPTVDFAEGLPGNRLDEIYKCDDLGENYRRRP